MGSGSTPALECFDQDCVNLSPKSRTGSQRSWFALSAQPPFTSIMATDDQRALVVLGAHPQDQAVLEGCSGNGIWKP